jgi:hypothetical protein
LAVVDETTFACGEANLPNDYKQAELVLEFKVSKLVGD